MKLRFGLPCILLYLFSIMSVSAYENGKPANSDRFPSVQIGVPVEGDHLEYCSAVSPRAKWLLVVRHCFVEGSQVKKILIKSDNDIEAKSFEVDQIFFPAMLRSESPSGDQPKLHFGFSSNQEGDLSKMVDPRILDVGYRKNGFLDLALIKLKDHIPVPTVELGKEPPRVGDFVLAGGYGRRWDPGIGEGGLLRLVSDFKAEEMALRYVEGYFTSKLNSPEMLTDSQEGVWIKNQLQEIKRARKFLRNFYSKYLAIDIRDVDLGSSRLTIDRREIEGSTQLGLILRPKKVSYFDSAIGELCDELKDSTIPQLRNFLISGVRLLAGVPGNQLNNSASSSGRAGILHGDSGGPLFTLNQDLSDGSLKLLGLNDFILNYFRPEGLEGIIRVDQKSPGGQWIKSVLDNDSP